MTRPRELSDGEASTGSMAERGLDPWRDETGESARLTLVDPSQLSTAVVHLDDAEFGWLIVVAEFRDLVGAGEFASGHGEA
jgi:hypothetical protein